MFLLCEGNMDQITYAVNLFGLFVVLINVYVAMASNFLTPGDSQGQKCTVIFLCIF